MIEENAHPSPAPPFERKPVIVDAHLDVAWNAIYHGRDLTQTVAAIRESESRERGIAMTSLTSMGEAGVAVVFATLLAQPAQPWSDVYDGYEVAQPVKRYSSPEEAQEQALEMLDMYREWAEQGLIRLVTSRTTLTEHLSLFSEDRVPGFLISMEGADPIVAPDDLTQWWERGLRVIGLAWGSTRYAGGTGSTQALTDLGRDLLVGMAELGFIHDASHLSEEAFWEAAGLPSQGLCVTHANPRKLMLPPAGTKASVPLNRHLSDEQMREVARSRSPVTHGVIGISILDDFLEPTWSFSSRPIEPTMKVQGAAQLRHMASVVGWDCIGIGSDVDSGFGQKETAADIDDVYDWHKIGDLVPASARTAILGGNWLRFLSETLP